MPSRSRERESPSRPVTAPPGAVTLVVAAVVAAGGCSRSGPPPPTVSVPIMPPTGGAPSAAPPRPVTPTPIKPAPLPAAPLANDAGRLRVRVGLSAGRTTRIGATTSWVLLQGDGLTVIATGGPGQAVEIGSVVAGRRVVATRPDGTRATVDAPVVVRATAGGLLTADGHPYRGDLVVNVPDSTLTIVNRLTVDEYLAGVVPLEIGPRAAAESAAVQAQAIAARSYAVVHLDAPRTPLYDVSATVLDQVYGGVDAETDVSNAAIASTRGLVLTYAGRVVNAPYHSSCGGSTAAPTEVWRSAPEPFLQPVSDRIPGSDRSYCDIAPGFEWTRTYSGPELDALIGRYLGQYATVSSGGPGRARDLAVGGRTPSGRVATLTVSTERGNYLLRGNDIRYVLRAGNGDILRSTAFSVETSTQTLDGLLSSVTIRGRGNGHGVGMCQWGAIGRARAGQSYREILAAYYPGTAVGLKP